jgi:ABC-type multidrug transport system ATPase subunit
VLVTEAPVLLLDEPFSGGLDPSGLMVLRHVLQRLAASKEVTIVMATPVPELVEGLADRVALIRDGQIGMAVS